MIEVEQQEDDEADLDDKGNASIDDMALAPNEAADPQDIVDSKVPPDIRDKYEVVSYRNAAVILAETRQTEFAEITDTLRAFTLTTHMIPQGRWQRIRDTQRILKMARNGHQCRSIRESFLAGRGSKNQKR